MDHGLTQYSHNHVILHNFHGAVTYVIYVAESVAFVYQVFTWRAEIRSYM